MSNNPKIRKPLKGAPAPQPAPQTPPQPQSAAAETPTPGESLGTDPKSLLLEWNKLRAAVQAINTMGNEENEKIQASQQKLKSLETQGLQIIGQLNIITRILRGMGIQPEQQVSVPPTPPPIPVEEQETEEVSPPRSTAQQAVRNRFLSS
jgi:hypothetical protein